MNGPFSMFIAVAISMILGKSLLANFGAETYQSMTLFMLCFANGFVLTRKRISDVSFWTVVMMTGYALNGGLFWLLMGFVILYIAIDSGLLAIKVTRK
jgi:hypothetical protein